MDISFTIPSHFSKKAFRYPWDLLMSAPDYDQYTCNLCGKESAVAHDFHREGGACQNCGSNIRCRALMLAFSHYLYGKPIPLIK